MVDRISKARRSENMRRIKSKGMKPEMTVRRLVYNMGYRYRLHRGDLPGNPDLVFVGRRKIIFVHGCFWHQHSRSKCCIKHTPRSNTGYWGLKLQRNVERDKLAQKKLRKLGWKVLTVWECELVPEPSLRSRLRAFLGDARRIS